MVARHGAPTSSAQGRRVFLDCEHFFDGYRADPDYAPRSLRRPRGRPAPRSWCCATPTAACCPCAGRSGDRRRRAARRRPAPGSASTARTTPPAPVANTARRGRRRRHARAVHRQRLRRARRQRQPVRGRGRNLELKLGLPVLPEGSLRETDPRLATPSPRSSTSPRPPTSRTSGASAFAHKAGLHASARSRSTRTSTTTSTPSGVGNDMRHAGHRAWPAAPRIELKGRELGHRPGRRPRAGRPGRRRRSRHLEAGGLAASRPLTRRFELLLRAEPVGRRPTSFDAGVLAGDPRRAPRDGTVRSPRRRSSCASEGERIVATAEGNGPVNALDTALRVGPRTGLPGAGRVRARPTTRSASWRACTAPTPRPGSSSSPRRHEEWATVGVAENVIAVPRGRPWRSAYTYREAAAGGGRAPAG